MKVKLIQKTQNPVDVMWVAARTCYSEKSPIELWGDSATTPTDKKWKLVKAVLESGHQSIAEHVYFTFGIEGISRACSHQLVRHRAGIVFSQQSQRYVEIKESQEELEKLFIESDYHKDYDNSELNNVLGKYFTENTFRNVNGYYYALDNYLEAIKNGEAAEDARRFLPNATKTNITMSINLRELIHICNLRLCTRAQKEIRDLFKSVKDEVVREFPELKEFLVPTCERDGFCSEHKSCGRKITKKEILKWQ